jgi:hypothetical protein
MPEKSGIPAYNPVYGEGEWTVRQHGASRRRTWLKGINGMDSPTVAIFTGWLC